MVYHAKETEKEIIYLFICNSIDVILLTESAERADSTSCQGD